MATWDEGLGDTDLLREWKPGAPAACLFPHLSPGPHGAGGRGQGDRTVAFRVHAGALSVLPTSTQRLVPSPCLITLNENGIKVAVSPGLPVRRAQPTRN